MDSVEKAQDELKVVAPAAPEQETPKSLDEVIGGLKGFGIEEFEEILTIKCKNRNLRLKIANVPTEDEMKSVQAADEFKGYLWVKRVKVELLSRSISWIEGIELRNLPLEKRFMPDITDPDKPLRDYQVVLRNILMGWGQELVEVLWKVLMTHSQNIEDRLKEQFPDNATLTEVERRLFERARKQIDEAQKAILDEQVSSRYNELETPEEPPKE
jgi:hypothetical protein